MSLLNDVQGDLLRRPYLYLRHGPNLSIVASETPYSYVEFYLESSRGANGARIPKG